VPNTGFSIWRLFPMGFAQLGLTIFPVFLGGSIYFF